jgi:signal transduction histidine kinase
LRERRPRRAQISAEQLASLSHEFRTPLNGVIGMARLLEGTRLTAEQRAYALALRESGEHLLTLVNDVLDFAKRAAWTCTRRRWRSRPCCAASPS